MLHVAQPGHWLGPVTGPAWLSLAQSKKHKKNKNYVCVKINLFYLFIR
jgi:hypothetical protein